MSDRTMKVAAGIGKLAAIVTVEAAFAAMVYVSRHNVPLVLFLVFLAGTAFEKMRAS